MENKKQRTATLGPEGTYSHRAARRISDEVEFYDSVPGTVEKLIHSDTEAAVVPIENSIEGSINATLDILTEREVYITNEIVLEIQHALIASSDDFDSVASHPQALAQCRNYLRQKEVETEAVSSTAQGVKEAIEDEKTGAIAHPETAQDHPQVEVIDENIQDFRNNQTRFVVLENQPNLESPEKHKTSLVIYPGDDYPGLLHDILYVFKEKGINLTRIESRPSKHELGDYVFHIDFEDGNPHSLIEDIESSVDIEWIKNLGTYGEYSTNH